MALGWSILITAFVARMGGPSTPVVFMTVSVRGVLQNLTKTLAVDMDRAASVSARPLTEMADRFGDVSRTARAAEQDGKAQVINEIRGKDEDGKLAVFSPDQVIYDVLEDRVGRRGISFPTKPSDRATRAQWVQRSDEKIDREFTYFWPATTVRTREEDWVPDPTPQPLPGADDPATERSIMVSSHAGSDVFAVKVRVQGPPTFEPARSIPGYHIPEQLVYPTRDVHLDGEEFGKLVATKKDELEAAAKTPESPVRLLACEAGAPEGDAAERAAVAMQANGVLREVQAPTGLVFRTFDNAGVSVLGIGGRGDADGNVLPALRIFPAPPRGDE